MTPTLSSPQPWRRFIPLAFSLANALFGFLAVATIAAMPGAAALPRAAAFLALALASDGLDGRLARRLGVSSHLGGELDSLADAVSFGVAPALLIVRAAGSSVAAMSGALVYLAATLYRLARFNTSSNDPDPAAHQSFLGLPSTGGAAGVLAAVALLAPAGPAALHALPLIGVALAALMASRIRYAHLLSRLGRPSAPVVALPLVALGAIVAFGPAALAVACLLYAAGGPSIAIGRAIFAPDRYAEALDLAQYGHRR